FTRSSPPATIIRSCHTAQCSLKSCQISNNTMTEHPIYCKSGTLRLRKLWKSLSMVSIGGYFICVIEEIKIWNVFYEYFIYKPESLDVHDDCFHLHNMKTGAVFLIEDFVKDNSCTLIA